MRTQARNDCGHCSTEPRTVVDQSSARMRAPIASGKYRLDELHLAEIHTATPRDDRPQVPEEYTVQSKSPILSVAEMILGCLTGSSAA